jgi:hypothetical protein
MRQTTVTMVTYHLLPHNIITWRPLYARIGVHPRFISTPIPFPYSDNESREEHVIPYPCIKTIV